ncbi:proline-rich transmembrane protein 4 [Heptranchias perlo]|uniref:proline-rich transmembrane protein 4 n=1 Tax=Heptranchias perlo TaxID=212740 RepID=UPI00355AB485
MSKTVSSDPSDISVQNLPSVGLQSTGSTATSPFTPLYPATLRTTHVSPQEPSLGRSLMPIYTFPGPQERPATVRPIPNSQSTEVLTKTKAPIQLTSDPLNADRTVLSSASELPPGILRPPSRGTGHQAVTSAMEQSNSRRSTYPVTGPKDVNQFYKEVLFNNTALGRSVPTSRSYEAGSPNKGTWDSLSLTPSSSTPTYQTQQAKVDEQAGRATAPTEPASTQDVTVTSEQDTDKGNQEDWDSARNLLTPTPAIPWTMPTEFTDPVPGDESSTGVGPTVQPTVSNRNLDGNCSSDEDWSSIYPDTQGTQDTSFNPHFLLVPPLFVVLHTDWNTALAEWGLAWDLHVYGLGSLFGLAAVTSALGVLYLPFRPPPGLGYFMALSGLLFLTSATRTFIFLYDAYCYQDKLPAIVALLLYDLGFPCLTSAFGVIILVLSLRSETQAVASRFQRSCFLTIIVFLHFTLTVSTILVITLLKQASFLLFVSHGIFVVLATVLSILYFAFYCHGCMVEVQVYNVKTSTPPMETLNTEPFGDTEHWGRVAKLAMWTAVFGLSCAASQLYAILYGLGLAGDHVFQPWPWWVFQFGTSLCEVGMCLTMSLIGIYPLFCIRKTTDRNCWTKMFCLSPTHASMKAPILSNAYQWSTFHQEKPLSCDAIVRSESECLPLYTMSNNQLSSGEEINLIYHSSETSEVKHLDFHLKHGGSSRTSSFISVQMDSNSTVDLRPPSPINLRRSIDEALFSEALIPESLFHWSRLHSSSNMSLCGNRSMPSSSEVFKEKAADRGLYRTSSCVGMERTEVGRAITNTFKKLNMTQALSSERWLDSSLSSVCRASQDGSSLVLCSSPERRGFSAISFEHKSFRNSSQTSLQSIPQITSQCQAVSTPETMGINGSPDSATQAEFVKICRQIDQLSISSDTIEL